MRRRAGETAWSDSGALADAGDSLVDQALAPLAERTSETELLERYDLPRRAPERAAEILEGGIAPFPELIGALHAKALTDELARQRSRRSS